jgi:hypothetical protein
LSKSPQVNLVISIKDIDGYINDLT